MTTRKNSRIAGLNAGLVVSVQVVVPKDVVTIIGPKVLDLVVMKSRVMLPVVPKAVLVRAMAAVEMLNVAIIARKAFDLTTTDAGLSLVHGDHTMERDRVAVSVRTILVIDVRDLAVAQDRTLDIVMRGAIININSGTVVRAEILDLAVSVIGTLSTFDTGDRMPFDTIVLDITASPRTIKGIGHTSGIMFRAADSDLIGLVINHGDDAAMRLTGRQWGNTIGIMGRSSVTRRDVIMPGRPHPIGCPLRSECSRRWIRTKMV